MRVAAERGDKTGSFLSSAMTGSEIRYAEALGCRGGGNDRGRTEYKSGWRGTNRKQIISRSGF